MKKISRLLIFICFLFCLISVANKDVIAFASDDVTTYHQIISDGVGDNTLVWRNGSINENNFNEKSVGDSSLSVDVTSSVNAEFYIDFNRVIDIKHGDGDDKSFNQTASLEFDLKLYCAPSWYMCYMLQDRGSEYASFPANQRYLRAEISLINYIDFEIIGEWQHVQIPISTFSTKGTYVNANGVKESTMVDITKISGIGFAHMFTGSQENLAKPNIFYDDMKIAVGALPDQYCGCDMVTPDEFNSMILNGDISMETVDISSYCTTRFTGGKGVGWTDQGAQNELTGFDLFGEQNFFGIKMNILDENQVDKTVIGLRNANASTSKLFTEKVEINIQDKIDGLYMLHNYSWSGKNMANYTYVYDDGTEYTLEVIADRHVYNWWGSAESDIAPIVWKGENEEANTFSLPIKLNLFAFLNPNPTKLVKTLKCEIVSTTGAVMISGITKCSTNGNGLYMPYLESIFNPSITNYYAYELADFNSIVGTALDVSYLLDKNIDEKGFISTKDGSFIYQNGQTAKFWGVNVSGQAIFSSKDDIDCLVNSIAAFGYNLVRVMDYDSGFYYPNIFGYNSSSGTVDKECLDLLYYFIGKCKDKGIYIDFCLLGGRYGSTFSSNGNLSQDQINDLSSGMKFEVFVDDSLKQGTKDLITTIFNQVNPYTNTKLSEDPVLAMVEIANESNLSNMYGIYVSTDQYEFVSKEYSAMLQEQFNDFLLKKYEKHSNLLAAWYEEGKVGVNGLVDGKLENKTIKINQSYLSSNYSNQRISDTFEFLYTLQNNFYTDMYNWCKTSKETNGLGLNIPVSGTTNLPSKELNDIYINAAFDYMARHYYWAHPTTGTEYSVDTAINTTSSMVQDISNNVFQYASGGAILGKPYIINETLCAEPNMYSAEFSIMNAAIHSLQGWSNAQFTFAVDDIDDENRTNMITNSFVIADHPTRQGTSSSSALLYYSNSILQNNATYYTGISTSEAMDPNTQSNATPAGSFIFSKVGSYFYDEDENGNKTYLYGADKYNLKNDSSLLEKAEHNIIVSEDGSVLWKNDGSIFMINTPTTQSAVGFYPQKEIELSNVKIDVDNEYANVTVSALGIDNNGNTFKDYSFDKSDRLLITAAGLCRNTEYTLSSDGTTIKDLGQGPVLVEQITGKITLKTTDEYDIYILNTSGQRVSKAMTSKDSNGYTVLHMNLNDKTMNYEAVRKSHNVVENVSRFDDVSSNMASKVEELYQYLPSITDDLYMLNQDVTRGDFTAALVRTLNLTSDNPRAYADVSRYYQGYEDLKIARGIGLLNGTQAKAYNEMKIAEAYLASYRALAHLGYKFTFNDSLLSSEVCQNITDEEKEALAYLYGSGFISKDELTEALNDSYMTREKAINILYSVKHKENAVANPLPNQQEPSDNNDGSNNTTNKKGCKSSLDLALYSLLALTVMTSIINKKRKIMK